MLCLLLSASPVCYHGLCTELCRDRLLTATEREDMTCFSDGRTEVKQKGRQTLTPCVPPSPSKTPSVSKPFHALLSFTKQTQTHFMFLALAHDVLSWKRLGSSQVEMIRRRCSSGLMLDDLSMEIEGGCKQRKCQKFVQLLLEPIVKSHSILILMQADDRKCTFHVVDPLLC